MTATKKKPVVRRKRVAKATTPVVPETKPVLVLRTCAKDMTSHNGFKWPKSGEVTCPDWNKAATCGNGLHGLLWGEGDGSLLNWDADAKWLVVAVEPCDIVDLKGKVKFPRGVVVHCGDRLSATAYLIERLTKSSSVVGALITAGDSGTAIAGYSGTATAGDRGTATAGDSGTATAGYSGTATAGYSGTATAGYSGTATAGDRGTATAGDRGTATAGDRGTAIAGYSGTATAGDRGTATAGDRGTAIAGDSGTATAGDRGTLQLWFYDYTNNRRRVVTLYVGEDGIKPKTKYRLDDNNKPVEVK